MLASATFIGLTAGLRLLVLGAGGVSAQVEIVEVNPKAPSGAKE